MSRSAKGTRFAAFAFVLALLVSVADLWSAVALFVVGGVALAWAMMFGKG